MDKSATKRSVPDTHGVLQIEAMRDEIDQLKARVVHIENVRFHAFFSLAGRIYLQK